MLIVLIGPKGAGKSYVGRLLQSAGKAHFLHVEPLWMAYYAECDRLGRARSIPDGINAVRPVIISALQQHRHVCVETTGGSRDILDDLLNAGAAAGVLVVRINAPLKTCLNRIEARDPTHQIPVPSDTIQEIYELNRNSKEPVALTLENVSMSDADILASFSRFL